MKLLRPLLFACAAVAFALVPLVTLAPVGEFFHPPASFSQGEIAAALTATVTTDVMTVLGIALIGVALVAAAFALGRSSVQRPIDIRLRGTAAGGHAFDQAFTPRYGARRTPG